MFSVENVKWPLKNKSDNPIKLFERSIPDGGFSPTKEEVDAMNRAKGTAELVNGLFHGLADILKTI